VPLPSAPPAQAQPSPLLTPPPAMGSTATDAASTFLSALGQSFARPAAAAPDPQPPAGLKAEPGSNGVGAAAVDDGEELPDYEVRTAGCTARSRTFNVPALIPPAAMSSARAA
jgi:hypothetical protein